MLFADFFTMLTRALLDISTPTNDLITSQYCTNRGIFTYSVLVLRLFWRSPLGIYSSTIIMLSSSVTTPCNCTKLLCTNWPIMAASLRNFTLSDSEHCELRVFTATWLRSFGYSYYYNNTSIDNVIACYIQVF